MSYSVADEIQEFEQAVYGKDVRSAMVDLANKLNDNLNDALTHEFVGVDTTLTQAGQGADAKVVGDRFAAVEASIPVVDATLTQSGQAADAGAVRNALTELVGEIGRVDGRVTSLWSQESADYIELDGRLDTVEAAIPTLATKTELTSGLAEKVSTTDLNARISTDITTDARSTTKMASPKAVKDYVDLALDPIYSETNTGYNISGATRVNSSGNRVISSISVPESVPFLQPIMARVEKGRASEIYLNLTVDTGKKVCLRCNEVVVDSTCIDTLIFVGVYESSRYTARCAVRNSNAAGQYPPFDVQVLASYTPGGSVATVNCVMEFSMLSVESLEIPEDVSDLNNDAGYLTEASAEAAGFCKNTSVTEKTVIATVQPTNMSHDQCYYGEYAMATNQWAQDLWDELVSQSNIGQRNYVSLGGSDVPMTYTSQLAQFDNNMYCPPDGSHGAPGVESVYPIDPNSIGVLVRKYTVGQTETLVLAFTESREGTDVSFNAVRSVQQNYATESYVDSAIAGLANGITMIDTATGYRYKVTVTNGQIALTAI